MSNAMPMGASSRLAAYILQTGRDVMTDRQLRQFDRMARRNELRTTGVLAHGASGMPVRRPHPHAGGAR